MCNRPLIIPFGLLILALPFVEQAQRIERSGQLKMIGA
jgi:hypothetical protein